jgi:hypothetical protein
MTVWHIEARAAALSCTQQLHQVPKARQMDLVGMASLSTLRQSPKSKLAEMAARCARLHKSTAPLSTVLHGTHLSECPNAPADATAGLLAEPATARLGQSATE